MAAETASLLTLVLSPAGQLQQYNSLPTSPASSQVITFINFRGGTN